MTTHHNPIETFHNANLDIFRASLHNLQQALYCQLDRIVSAQVFLIISLQEFTNGLRRSPNSICLADPKHNLASPEEKARTFQAL